MADSLSGDPITQNTYAGKIGSGDGKIHIIPCLSAPSVKNEGTLIIKAVIRALAGVSDVSAILSSESELPEQKGIARVTLEPAAANLGGINTDRSPHFSHPIAGQDIIGTSDYPDGGMKRMDAAFNLFGEQSVSCTVIDPANGYAYFGTSISPGIVIRLELTQKGFLKGTRFNLPELGSVNEARFYSYAATGNVRLSIYDDSA